ncbi:MAG: hypothetical protein OXG06_02095 [Gammaproteobacteria bacterium]|nr:hypothetical protein [Gammaproteobacteria bacterium]
MKQVKGKKTLKVKAHKRGRPVTKKMPPKVPDSPENIAKAIMKGSPKKDWDYLKED